MQGPDPKQGNVFFDARHGGQFTAKRGICPEVGSVFVIQANLTTQKTQVVEMNFINPAIQGVAQRAQRADFLDLHLGANFLPKLTHRALPRRFFCLDVPGRKSP